MALAVPTRRRLTGQLLYGLLWLAITAFAIALKPNPSGHGTHELLGLPPCPSALFMDRPCPGCGLTTSFAALLHGQFAFAFHAHPLGPLLYLFLTWTGLTALIRWARAERFDITTPRWSAGILAGALLFLAFGLARMALVDHYRSPSEKAYLSLNK